jgi:hypothetical protein
MKPVPEVIQCEVVGPASVRLAFRDGWKGVLNLEPIFRGRIFGALKSPAKFREVSIQNGTLTWSNGADVCPSVLRYWCELERVCSQDELDAHFMGTFPKPKSVVAEAAPTFSTGSKLKPASR